MPYENYIEDSYYNDDEKLKTISILEGDSGFFKTLEYVPSSIDEYLEMKRKQYEVEEAKAVEENANDKDEIKEYIDESGNVVKVVTVNSAPLAAAAPGSVQPVQVTPVDLQDANFSVSSANTDDLGRLYGANGIVYLFDRGIDIVGPDGHKEHEEFDNDWRLHHSPEILRICHDVYGVDLGQPNSEFEEYLTATANDIALMLYESSSCQIFLPLQITEAQLDEIIAEVEPRKDLFVFDLCAGSSLDDAMFGETLNGDDVLTFLRLLKERLVAQREETESEEEVLSARQSYINALMEYIKDNDMALNDYFTMVGEKLRAGDTSSLPEFEAKNPFLTPEDITKLIDSDEERIVEYFASTMTRVIELNLEQLDKEDKKEENNKEDEEIEKEVREAYIRLLMRYINEKGMSLEDYYRLLAVKLRNGDVYSIPRFEGINPFLSEDDIRRLLDEKDERIIDYFANAMTRVIELNLENMNKEETNTNDLDNIPDKTNNPSNSNNNDGPNDNNDGPTNNNNPTDFNFEDLSDEDDYHDDDSLDLDEMEYLDDKTNYMSGIKITYINTDLINHMNGLAVIREPKSGRINIYGYENEDINLSGKKVIEAADSKIESGYYVNLSEYIGILAHGIEDQYGSDSNFAFVDENGEYLNFYDVINNIMATCRLEGALRYGREYKDTSFDSYEELEEQYTGNKGIFKGVELTKGLYVRRDILIDELNKYRVAITKENIDNISHTR